MLIVSVLARNNDGTSKISLSIICDRETNKFIIIIIAASATTTRIKKRISRPPPFYPFLTFFIVDEEELVQLRLRIELDPLFLSRDDDAPTTSFLARCLVVVVCLAHDSKNWISWSRRMRSSDLAEALVLVLLLLLALVDDSNLCTCFRL